MSYKQEFPRAGTILICKSDGYLTGFANLTGGKEYTLLSDCTQEVWHCGPNNDSPFYPEVKVHLLDDKGQEIRCNLSRFRVQA